MSILAPCMRDRKMRNAIRYRQKAKDWFTVMIGASLTAIGIVSLILLAVIVSSCTTFDYEQRQAELVAAKGCYCAGSNCDELKSAAGQAAVAAAGGQVVNITKVEKPKE